MPSNHLILCHLLLLDETAVAATETPQVFPRMMVIPGTSMMVIPSSWNDPFTKVWIKIIWSCVGGHAVLCPSMDCAGCLEMLTLGFCPPEVGFILASPSIDVLCLLYIKPTLDHVLFPVIAIKLLMYSFTLGRSGHLWVPDTVLSTKCTEASDGAGASVFADCTAERQRRP